MIYALQTERGKVNIARLVLRKITREVISRFSEVVYIANEKGQSTSLLNMMSENKEVNFIQIKKAEDKIVIKINVVLKFGVSISNTSKKIIAETKKEIFNLTGIEIDSVIVNIIGLKSKNIVKRDIQIKGWLGYGRFINTN